jgi:hypothetical protein
MENVCRIVELKFSSDGRYLFAIVISNEHKSVHILAWDFSEKVPRYHSKVMLE